MILIRHIHHVRVERAPVGETAATARTRFAEVFPRGALRRMTHLGMLVGSALDGVTPEPDDAVVYATTFAETRALEDYLASFPSPSPLLFQTSIHPSAVQQVFIGRQKAVGRFWPVTGRDRIVEQALMTALLEPAPRVILTGGEERGTWMLEHGMASDASFAFGLVLGASAPEAVGRITFASGVGSVDPCPTLLGFAEALAARRTCEWQGIAGRWCVAWS